MTPEMTSTVDDTAKQLHVSPEQLISWIERGQLHGVRGPDGRWRVTDTDVAALLQRLRAGTPQPEE